MATSTQTFIEVDRIKPAADNLRADVGDVAELAASIKAVGLLEPLVLAQLETNGTQDYTVVIGHRRLAAAKVAGLKTVPALVRSGLTDKERVEAMLIENLQREDLAALEEAEGYRRLGELGMSQQEIAKAIGRSQAHVSKRLALLKLPEAARTALAAGALSLIDANELVAYVDDPEVIAQTLAQMKESAKRGWQDPAGRLAESIKARLGAERKRAAAIKQLTDAKISVIDVRNGYYQGSGAELGEGFGRIPMAPAAHAKAHAGSHAAWVDYDGRVRYVCTKPADHVKDTTAKVAKAAKQISAPRSAGGGGKDSAAAKAKAAESRERNKALRAAAPGRLKAIAARITDSRAKREDVVDFTLRQLLQLVIYSNNGRGAAEMAADHLGVKSRTQDGAAKFGTFIGSGRGSRDRLLKLAHTIALYSGEVPFRTMLERSYFDQELVHNASRTVEQLRLAGYKPVPEEVKAISEARKQAGSWRPAFDA